MKTKSEYIMRPTTQIRASDLIELLRESSGLMTEEDFVAVDNDPELLTRPTIKMPAVKGCDMVEILDENGVPWLTEALPL